MLLFFDKIWYNGHWRSNGLNRVNALRLYLQGGGNRMSDIIKRILTDNAARDVEKIDSFAMSFSNVMEPWQDV